MTAKRVASIAMLLAATAVVVAGCAPESPSPTISATVASSAPSTAAATTRRSLDPVPRPTFGPSPTTAVIESDRFPADLNGRWLSRSFEDPFEVVVGTLGSPDRLRLPGEMSLLGRDGDRIVTMRWTAATSTISVWSRSSGDRLAGPFDVPSSYEIGRSAGGNVVVATKHESPDDLAGLSLISLSDGSIDDLVEATPQGPDSHLYREMTVSADGAVVVTSVCVFDVDFTGDCRDTHVFDVATRQLKSSPDVGRAKVIAVVGNRLLLYSPTRAQLRSESGALIWTTKAFPKSYFLWNVDVIDASTIVATLYSYDAGGSSRILLIDAATGHARTVYRHAGAMAFGADSSLSTPDRLALPVGDASTSCDHDSNGFCDPGSIDVWDLATLDVASGEITEHAIHVTITP